MARIDDYINAKKIAVKDLSQKDITDVVKKSGLEIKDNFIIIPFLNRTYKVNYPDFEFIDFSDASMEVPIQEQVLISHYLSGEKPEFFSGRQVTYREVKGASFYFGPFVKRAVDPLKKVFGSNIKGFINAAEKLNSKKISAGDTGYEFLIFPKIPVQLIIWEADDEFAAEANILFDSTIENILSPEDIAWMSGMLVYRLMSFSR